MPVAVQSTRAEAVCPVRALLFFLASLQLGFCCSARCWPGGLGSAARGLHAAGSGTCARSRIVMQLAILLCRGSAFGYARLRTHA